jgi:hypothetical protein
MGGNVDVELGNSSTTQLSLGSTPVRTLYGVASGAIRLAADGYGKSSAPSGPVVKAYYGNSGQYYQLATSYFPGLTSSLSKFGSKSLSLATDSNFPSTSAVLIPLNTSSTGSLYNLSGTYTLECWYYITQPYTSPNYYGPAYTSLFGGTPSSFTSNNIKPTTFAPDLIWVHPYAGSPSQNSIHEQTAWAVSGSFYTTNDQNTPDVPINQWVHVALVVNNNGSQFSTWVNGVKRLDQITMAGGPLNAMQWLCLNMQGGCAAYIDEIRVSNIDRYGYTNSTITPPTSAFTSDSNTMLYMNFE